MTRTIRRNSRPAHPRRGVTLVEMLVTVAVLVIIMTVMVQIFQSATGALTAAQTIQDLDNQLKLLDSTIRSDLGGATAHFTPPLDPSTTWAISSTSRTNLPTCRAKTATTACGSRPRRPPASRSRAGCG